MGFVGKQFGKLSPCQFGWYEEEVEEENIEEVCINYTITNKCNTTVCNSIFAALFETCHLFISSVLKE